MPNKPKPKPASKSYWGSKLLAGQKIIIKLAGVK